jgi:hypothetical protein
MDSVHVPGFASGDEWTVGDPGRVKRIAVAGSHEFRVYGSVHTTAAGEGPQPHLGQLVHVVLIHPEHPDWPKPVLLGGDASEELGWMSADQLALVWCLAAASRGVKCWCNVSHGL